MSSAPRMLSLFVSAARRSPSCEVQCSESSATMSVSGSRLTGCPAIPAVGSGRVGAGTGLSLGGLPPHAMRRAITPHAPRTK
ncbi:MAG: hypothetical protein DMD53_14410 [Gemmatimonadetes bacterium]|nr:MAG: hypothetical protein DMD53_14410 [Gemmatimonadota bacterium]